MVAIGNHIRVTDFQTLPGIPGDIINVYYFEVLGVVGAPTIQGLSGALGTWFFTEFIYPMLGMTATALAHQSILVESMENWATEFTTVLPDDPCVGLVVGGYSSSATAWSFSLIRELRTTRNGSKRYAAVPESQVDNNVPISGLTGVVDAVKINLTRGWTITNGDGDSMNIAPVIAKSPISPATRPSVYNNIIGCQFRGVGSQNSRKRLLS